MHAVYTNSFPVFTVMHPVYTNSFPVFTVMHAVNTNSFPIFTVMHAVYTSIFYLPRALLAQIDIVCEELAAKRFLREPVSAVVRVSGKPV